MSQGGRKTQEDVANVVANSSPGPDYEETIPGNGEFSSASIDRMQEINFYATRRFLWEQKYPGQMDFSKASGVVREKLV